ncbi:hypothetical protein HZR84_00465 [Hyphobacterium sp. CCMP332]|nr:hypothetical protein HZR84_00465 [Hyphobacterium sp. CCMP332]
MKEFLNKLKKWTFRLIVVAAIVFICVIVFLSSMTYSEGFIIGKATSFSKKGIIFKTYEGEIKVSGSDLAELEGLESGKWAFSVKKNIEKEVLESIEKAIEENKRAKFYYKEKYWKSSWSGDTKYYVYDVEILE